MGHAKSIRPWLFLGNIVNAILPHVPGSIVEIGAGFSSHVLAECALLWKRRLYTCDCDEEIFKLYKLPRHKHHYLYNMLSVQFCDTLQIGFYKSNISLPAIVFLDGSHQAIDVMEDFEFFISYLAEGGVIFLHDTLPFANYKITHNGKYCGDVYKIRQILENDKTRNFQVWTWRYKKQAQNCGLTMIQKKEKDPPYFRR